MEQLVARWAHNPKVTGSSPVPATKFPDIGRDFFCTILSHIQRPFYLPKSLHTFRAFLGCGT